MALPISLYQQQVNNGAITTCTSYAQNFYGKTVPVNGFRYRLIAGPGPWIYNTIGFYVNKGLPTFHINTPNPGAINPDTKTDCMLYVKNNYGSRYLDENLYSGKMAIKIRGNSTSGFVKKPWALDLDIKTNLLNYPGEKDWSVLAEWLDPSFMNNALMFRISRAAMISTWTPVVRHIEIYLNGEYQGIYSFIEKVEEGTDRVKLIKLLPGDLTMPNISGGRLMEFVVNSQESEADLLASFTTPATINFKGEPHSHIVKYPKPEDNVPAQLTWISDWVNEMETVLNGVGFTDPTNGWRKYISVDEAVIFYILQELGSNYDGAAKSLYYKKDRNGLLMFGPNWDYDNSLQQASVTGLVYDHPWFVRLKEDPYFINQIKIRYTALRPLILAELPNIDKNAAQLINSGAIARNFAKWPAAMPVGKTYPQLITEKKAWLTNRVAYLDTQFLIP